MNVEASSSSNLKLWSEKSVLPCIECLHVKMLCYDNYVLTVKLYLLQGDIVVACIFCHRLKYYKLIDSVP